MEINVLFPARTGPRPPGWGLSGMQGASTESLFDDDVIEWLLQTTLLSLMTEVHPWAQMYEHHRNVKCTDHQQYQPELPSAQGGPRGTGGQRVLTGSEAGLSPRRFAGWASEWRGLPVAKPRSNLNVP